MARITNLQQYRIDRENRGRILGIRHVMVSGVRLCVKLIINDDLSLQWLNTLNWKVTHCQTGRSAMAGGSKHTPLIRVLYRDEEGITIEIKPILGSMGRIEMNEQFSIDIETEAETLHFLNQPSTPDDLRKQESSTKQASKTRSGHLTLVQG